MSSQAPFLTDFDLYLEKRNGSTWTVVAKSDSPQSVETVNYNGTAGITETGATSSTLPSSITFHHGYDTFDATFSGSGSATITATGPDAITSRVQSKGGAFKMPNGQTVPIPDSDTVTVSRRLGPCKPGDRQITH